MIKNYIKTAWRNLLRNKSYAAINIIGLAVGVAACLLIFLVIQFETSFDNFHKNKENIYRVVTVSKTPAGTDFDSGVPWPTTEALRVDYPQVQATSVFKNGGQISVLNSGGQAIKKFSEELIYFADPQFFSTFSFDWLAGDKKTALVAPGTVVLTKDAAEKYFGNWKDAMGKTIKYENKNILKVPVF